MGRPFLLLALALGVAGCRGEPPEPPAPPMQSEPATPFDAAPLVFDTTEPPEQTVQIPPRPAPRPPEPTRTPPLPEPTPPAPPPAGVSGSCDVRATEGFCFAYTGPGWTAAEAEDHCDAAPDAAFGPAACPLDDRVATCVYRRPSAPGREIVYTYYAPFDLTLAELACPGTFTRVNGSAR